MVTPLIEARSLDKNGPSNPGKADRSATNDYKITRLITK
jgi:hypothetical protein